MVRSPGSMFVGFVFIVGVCGAMFWPHGPNSARSQSGEGEVVNSVGMKFARIPRGTYSMGSPETEEGRRADEPVHEVRITKPFHIAAFEVTQKQYERIMGANPSFFTRNGVAKLKLKTKDTHQYPIEDVTWHQAVEFCKKLSETADEKARKFTYRLPTEAEWEYACRGGTRTALHYGDAVSSYEANFNGVAPLGNARRGYFLAAPWTVGGYKANAFGLFDMHGNVMEWCADWYDPDFYAAGPKEDPIGPTRGEERVCRGGGWPNTARTCRSAARFHFPPHSSSYSIGFRVVLTMPE